jgi:gliding motility-associated-like protein
MLLLPFVVNTTSAQVYGKLELLPDNKTYQVSITPERSLTTPLNRTNSAQITLVAPSGGLKITNFKSIAGDWRVGNSIAESPVENHNFNYYFIELESPMNDVNYVAGQEIILFTFENELTCIGDVAIIDDDSDPFLPPNSLNLNVGNLFTILGYGPVNAYLGSETRNAGCPDELEATAIISSDDLLCHDDLTTMTIDIEGGEAPYLIKWTNTETGMVDSIISELFNRPVTLQNIAKGTYDIEIIDVKNAVIFLNQTITGPEPLQLELALKHSNCEESQDGVIEITHIEGGSGGIADFQFDWSNGISNTTLINNLSEGTYQVTVLDGNNCETVQEAIIKTDGWIDLQIEGQDISCFGSNDGQIISTASGKNPPFNYTWEADNGNSGNDDNLSNLQGGIYTITVTDATGVCNQVETIEIKEPAEILAAVLIDSAAICELKTESELTVANVVNNRGALSYSLDGINFSSNNSFVVNMGASYTLTVQDAAGCTADLDVEVPAPSGLELSLPADLVLKLGDDMQLDANWEATSAVTFQWEPADGLSCLDCPNPMLTPTRTTTYTLTVSDENGCIKEASVIVYLSTTRRVYTPNIFSPNGDGHNDLFTIFTSTDAVAVNSLQIFDRWGERVYLSPDDFVAGDEYNYGWDGTYAGEQAPNGVYVFLAEISFIDGKTEVFKGEVNLVR